MIANPQEIKSLFPVFESNSSLVYLDNAATTQRPKIVLEAMSEFERQGVANVHRGLYSLAEKATAQYENAREKVANFIGTTKECVAFTKGATESINIVAQGFIKHQLNEGDNVLITHMEHHANLIPWQQICAERKAKLAAIPIDASGDLDLSNLDSLIDSHTKLLAITHISNTIGTINPIKEIIAKAKSKNIPVLLDSAQSIGLHALDVEKLEVDFIVFSAHKMFGPFGVGILYAEPKHHANIRPPTFGGGAIKNVTLQKTEWLDFPRHLEAGTPNVSGVVGLSAAIDFLNSLDIERMLKHIEQLAEFFCTELNKLQGFTIVGNPKKRGGIVSFVHEKIHPHDIASFLASKNIAVRAGHHCTQPLLDSLGIPATVRASFSIYNTEEDVRKIVLALNEAEKFWS